MTKRWGLLFLVFFGILISYIDRGNLSIAAGAIMRDFEMPPGSMGVLLSAFFWTYAICQLPAGFVVDRFGIRLVYAGAFLAWSIASAGVAFSRGPHDLLALRLILGLAESIGPIASLTFIRQNFTGPEQGLPMSIYIAGQTIGPACGALLGATLLADFGWRTLFLVTGLGALLWVPAWTYFAPRGKQNAGEVVDPGLGHWPWHFISSSASFWALAACVFFFSYYWYFVLTWMPSYLTMARGYSTVGMGKSLSAPLFSMAVVNVLAGFIADKLIRGSGRVYGVRLTFAAFGLLGASAILLLNVLPGHGPVLPVLVISICGFGLASSNFWAIAQYTSPSRMVGRAIGFLNTLSQVGGVIAPLITGWSLGPHKDFRPAIFIAGLCPLVSAALLMLAGPGRLQQLKSRLDFSFTPLAGQER